MRITEVQIDGFGAWSDLALDHVSEGLTVFYGPNEAGKTTLMEFIRSVLYGYSPERRTRYLPPVSGGRGGGALSVVGAGGRFTIRRTPGSLSGDDLGRVEVLAANGSRQGQHVLGTLLSGIDEPIFKNVFAVGLRELQELGTLDDTEAAAQLYKLTSGLDRVSLIDVMRQLDASRNALLAADGSRGELVDLLESRDRLRAETNELAGGGQRWVQLAAQRKQLQDELARLEESIERMEREARAVEVAIQIRGDWFQRLEASAKLEKLGPPVALPENAVQRLDALQAKIAEHRQEIEQIQRRRRVIVEEAASQPINRQLWSRASRIEALCEHSPWIGSLEDQLRRLREEIGESEREVRAQWERLGLAPGTAPAITPELTQRAMTALRAPAAAVQQAAERCQQTQAELAEARREGEEFARQLQAELADTGQSELQVALDEAGQRVTLVRRRIQLEERSEKLDRHRKELEQDRRELLEEQVLPVSTLVWCGFPFVLGVGMILASFFWEWVAKLGWTVTVLGFACWAIAVVTKLLLEKSMGQELDACVRELQKVKKQLAALAEEREELDQRLPAGGGPLDARAAAAEQYVKRLEALTPLETKCQAAVHKSKAEEDAVARSAEELREAQQQWRSALRSSGLPESLQPEHIQQLSDEGDQTVQMGRRLEARRGELREREKELAAITQRIQTLLKEVQITPASDDPRTQLRQVAAVLAEQRRWIERRKELRNEHRDRKRAFREAAGKLRKLLGERHALLREANAADDVELRKLAARQTRINELTTHRDQLNQRIRLSIGSQCPESAVAEVLQTHGDEKLEPYWERLLARLQDAQARLTQLHEQRGQMLQEMKTLSEDRRLGEARLSLASVEERIGRAARRWRLLAVTGLMLEAIRQIYETERQPETLSEASTYLIRLSEGRYQRIWTPLSEDILRIDTATGESLPLDVLSQGTREAVFLSLRLALAAAYARRGALLPLVLDDVLVNLDVRRARMAAEVLRDFASQGHQMLLFTCHHHIFRIFQAAHAEVRMLPVREGLDASDWADEMQPPAAASEASESAVPEVSALAEPAVVADESPAEILDAADDPVYAIDEDQCEVLEAEPEADLQPEPQPLEQSDEDEAEEQSSIAEDSGDRQLEPDDAANAEAEAAQEADEGSWDDDQELRLAEDEDLVSIPAGSSRTTMPELWWEVDAPTPR